MEEILTLAQQLIQLHSISDDNAALRKATLFVEKRLKQFTIQTFNSKGKPSLLIHNAKLGTKHFKIILNAHLDVVQAKEKQFRAEIKAGKLYGRGAYDMKAAAAVMITLFKEIATSVAYPLALQIVTDEEIGGYNGTKYQIEKGITADFVIVGEYTNFAITNEAKSPLWLKLTVKGKASHAAHPWLGENAVWKTYDIVKRIQSLYPILQKSTWETTINLAKIETPNNAFNRVPDECVAWLDIRIIPQEQENILEKIKKILPKDVTLEIVVQETPAYTDPDNSFIKKLQQSITNVLNKKSTIMRAPGASDVRFYNANNVPGVEFGPIGANQHADDEWVDIKSLENYYQILKQFLLSIK